MKKFVMNNIAPLLMSVIILICIPVSDYGIANLVKELVSRLSRNLFLVLSLLIPVVAGMGLNFGIVLGAMAGQFALILISDWGIVGLQGIALASIISVPFAIALGILGGTVLNNAKGREMITSMILGFFINGVYQLIVLYGMGKVIPMMNEDILLSRGYGVRNTVDLKNIRKALDGALELKLGDISIPILTIVLIILLCLFIIWFRKTKIGQDMRAVGMDMEVASSTGINVNRTRIISIIVSTILASFGQIIYLQNMGTLNSYNSHEQIGMFSIAALLVGGATASKASISNAITGVVLFHAMFVLAPEAARKLLGDPAVGEYFRVFISYGIVALVLILHQWRREKEKQEMRNREFQEKLGQVMADGK